MEEAVVTVTPDGAYVAGNSQGVSFFICCMRDTIKLQALHLWAYVFAWFMQ
jgi:D-serine deaminase-like pyridoxal phosphate-dependent protein